jgi:hypothetical protein
MYIHPNLMSISKRLSQLNLEIHKISHQKHLVIDEDIIF